MSSYVPTLDLWLLVRNLPNDVNGFITRDSEGTNYIIINENASESTKLNTLLHELVHLIRGDLDSDKPREELEKDIVKRYK